MNKPRKKQVDPKKQTLKALEDKLVETVIIPEDELYINKVLEPRQLLFAVEYVKDYNSAAAARRAGYSKSNGNIVGNNLLKNPLIKEEIERLEILKQQCSLVSREFITGEILKLIQDSYSADRPDRLTITKCLDMLNKMNGFYSPETQVNIQNNINEIEIIIVNSKK